MTRALALLQVAQTPAPMPDFPVPPPIEILPPWMVLPPQVIVLVSLAFFAACALVLYPLAKALGQRLAGRGPEDAALRAELAHLQDRVRDVEQIQHRVAELEDRLDFAERLLAERRAPEQLPRT